MITSNLKIQSTHKKRNETSDWRILRLTIIYIYNEESIPMTKIEYKFYRASLHRKQI